MTGRRYVVAKVACLVGLWLTAAGCTRNNDAPPPGGTSQGPESTPASQAVSADQNVAIEFRSEPDPPASGDNIFEVVVTRPDGSPVTDATVTTVFSMPAMPSMNMPAMRSEATLAHETSGRYRGPGQLSMGGTWNVTVTVSRGGEQLGTARFSVVAREGTHHGCR